MTPEADLAQDDYFYEIQLTNKQLVFYFLAGATGLVLSFLAGVMVGRGVDQGTADVQAARPIGEERVVAEEAPRPAPSVEELTYSHRLEGEKTEDRLEKAKPSPDSGSTKAPAPAPAAKPAEARVAAAAPPPPAPAGATPVSKKPSPTVAAAKPTPPPGAVAGTAPPAPAPAGGFALQVG